MAVKQITEDLYWIGVLDPDLRVFDIIMYTEFGTSYNSYLLKGSEKNAIFEASKLKFFEEYLNNIKSIMPLDQIDYLILDHTEPDHSGAIEQLVALNPKIKLVGSVAAISFMKEICNCDFNSVVVRDGDTLSLGNKTLRFISAPNLHWPDTMFTYIEEDGILATCDAFGNHYAFEGITNNNLTDEDEEDYYKSMRYYFDVIISPFKSNVLDAIRKIENLTINMILTGHGPVLVENPRVNVELYKQWATETNPNDKKTVVIPYVSAYGYTEMLGKKIAEGIHAAGDIDVRLYDLVYVDSSMILGELYWADGILLGTPTFVGEALRPIWDLAVSMNAKNYGRKIASAFGSYGWSGEGVDHIMQRLNQLNMKLYGEGLKVRFKPNDSDLQNAYEFGYGFGASVLAGKIVENVQAAKVKKAWRCLVCGEIVEGTNPPDVCPVCGVGPDQFVEIEVSDIAFKSDKVENFIIVGNGAAGTAACEEIRKRNKNCSIEIISTENVIAYNRPMLTKGILSDIDEINFYIKPREWYDENNIILTLGTTVREIREEFKGLILSNGETRSYDKLIIATGAESFIPPIKGADQEGVFAIRFLAGVNALQKYLKKVNKAVVIGGGVLGLEAAWELKRAGKDVTVIEQSKNIMGKQLDDKGSALLKKATEKSGIKVIAGIGIEEITGSGKATGVKLADGTIAEGELGILSTGIRQNIGLAKGTNVLAERSIKVNEKMETTATDIYACGYCAEFNGVNYAIWRQAIEMVTFAGINAVGDEAVYETIIPANSFKGMGTSLFAVGDNGKDPEKSYKTFEIQDDAKGTYEKYYFVNNRFCGGILLGDVSKTSKLLEGYKKQDPISKFVK